MGMSHGDPKTYPRLANVIGYCAVDEVLAVAEAVVTTQRDYGDRTNRKHARLKYTIDDRGLDWFLREVRERSGTKLSEAQPYTFASNGDTYGWQQDDAGLWHYTLFVQNGRVADVGERRLMAGLRSIATQIDGEFRLTPNQNLVLGKIGDRDKDAVARLLADYGIENSEQATPLRLHSLACVALPTCGLAMAESERYLPHLIDRIDEILADVGLTDDAITIRMTGCPNGCARPYIAEIGLVGKGPARYNLYLGAGFAGDRLNCLYRENANETEIIEALSPLLQRYATERADHERFGDFVIRAGVVRNIVEGRQFHGERDGG